MIRQSKQHLAAAGERYGEHFRFAATVGLLTLAAGMAALIHAAVPALCTHTCSSIVSRLGTLFGERRRLEEVTQQSSGAITFVGLILLSGMMVTGLLAGGAPRLLGAAVAAMALSLPLTFLITNPQLERVDLD